MNYNDYSNNNGKPKTGSVKDSLFIKTKRAGIILYTSYSDIVYLCLGRDSRTHEFSDFGGRSEKGEFAVDTALREFHEETVNAFRIDKEDIMDSLCVYDRDSMVIFVRVLENPNTMCTLFNKKVETCKKPEVCGLVWIDFFNLTLCLHSASKGNPSGLIFNRLEMLLKKTKDLHIEL